MTLDEKWDFLEEGRKDEEKSVFIGSWDYRRQPFGPASRTFLSLTGNRSGITVPLFWKAARILKFFWQSTKRRRIGH